MTINIATASWGELILSTVLLLGIVTGFWWFSNFWERMWTDSLQSRTVERRFLRWQRFAFRGRYPFGRWRKPWSVSYVHAVMLAGRAILVFILLVWVLVLGKRVIG